MSKWLKSFVVVPWLGVACTFMPASETAKSNPEKAPVPEASVASLVKSDAEIQRVSMTRLYNDTCAKCHGDNAQGGGSGTPSLINLDKFDQKWDKPFFDAIKNGVPNMGMEAYGQTMDDREIWGLVVHIRELQARGLRAQTGSPKADAAGVYKSKHHDYKIETVVDQDQGLRTPWAVDWLPDGTMLITNRSGFLSVARNGKVVGQVQGIPASAEIGQGGLMEVAVHPNYRSNGWVYLGYTEPAPGGGRSGQTKIVRGKITFSGGNATWGSQQTIWQGPPESYTGVGVHFGTRITFDGKGKIYFAVGERGGNMAAQSLETSIGKIYRLNEDGSEPADNPFVGKTPIKGIWSYGHRNPQGLIVGLDGRVWSTEHGPRGGDELNLIEKGKNYGWPVYGYSINYNDAPLHTPWPKAGEEIAQPVFRWLPSIGACGLDVAKGKAFPKWEGDLFAGGLSGANVDRFKVKDGKMLEREEIVHGMGRVREVATGPDGMIYVALNQPDKIIRIAPAR